MHSKLMLLFHAEYLRIAVPSANLVRYDWGEIGVIENVGSACVATVQIFR
jgi:Tyrosyl-DNA phosphodiesterase